VLTSATPLPFQLLLFDLDGTLVDSLPDIAGALNAALAEQSAAPLPVDVVRGLVGEGVRRLAEKAVAVSGRPLDADALARDIIRRYSERPCVQSRLYPGIADALSTLKAGGRRLAVLTNKHGGVARGLLAALGVEGAFDAVVGDGDGYPRKPAPDAARALMQRLGAPAAATLMIGDGLPDLAMARAAGCPVAAVTWGYTDRAALAAEVPNHLVDDPAALVRLSCT
jgi:phosphoglycolate phosphatase